MSDGKNKKSMKNTFKNIPTGARITILTMMVFGAGSAIYVFNSFGSDSSGQEGALGPVSSSSVDLGSKKVEGYKVGATPIVDENSPLAKQEKKAREMELEKAKKEEGGGYMSPFKISSQQGSDSGTNEQSNSDFIDSLLNEVDKKAEKQIEKERNAKTIPNGLDDVVDRDEEERLRQERLARMEAELAKSKAAMAQGGLYDENGNLTYNSKGQKVIYKTKKVRAYASPETQIKEGAEKELNASKQVSQRFIAQAAELSGINLAKYNGASGGGKGGLLDGAFGGSGSDSKTNNYNPANDPTNDAFYAPYVNQDRHIPKPDYEGLNNTRQAVMASLGPGQYGPGNGAQSISSGGASGSVRGSSSPQPYQFGGGDDQNYEYGYSNATLNKSYTNPGLPYKAIGDVCYGKLKMNVNSDAPTPVRVQFLDRRCGKLFNRIAVAAPARVGEYVTLEFKGINVNGKTQAINAIALDPDSESALFQDSLDRHIFSRYISLAAAAALPGWADAVTGTDVEEDEDGSTRERQAPVEALSDQLAVVGGAIGEALTPVLQANFDRPPTVKVYNNKDILIMFMGDFFIE